MFSSLQLELESLSPILDRFLKIIQSLNPVCLAQVLLDFSSVVRSQFWDGRHTGPDFISPMSSLTKRQSGYLARLLTQHCRSLQASELGDSDASSRSNSGLDNLKASSTTSGSVSAYRQVSPQTVAILDLDDVPTPRQEWQYATSANIDLMVLVPILLNVLVLLGTRRWSPAREYIMIDFVAALTLGPGSLTLIRRTALHTTELDPGDGCTVLLDDDLTVIILGSQRIVEAITEGGFYLSYSEPSSLPPSENQTQTATQTAERWQEKQFFSDFLHGKLEGACCGLCEAIVIRFLHLKLSIPNIKEVAFTMILGRIMTKIYWWLPQMFTNDSVLVVTGMTSVRILARFLGELFGILVAAACFASASSATILLHCTSFLMQSSYFGLFAKFALRSQNYRIRIERFLDALGPAPIRKVSFDSRTAAATFVCLVLSRGPRPVKSVHVSGILNTLIPNQRDVWRAWKARVADRITHESEQRMTFAPTIPTFPDERQERLKLLLDEAKLAYDKYRLLPRKQNAVVRSASR